MPALELESLVWGWDSYSTVGDFTAEISLPIFNQYMWVWDQPIPGLCPSY